jgi:hypothetical protein
MSEQKHTPGPWSVPHFALSDEHWQRQGEKLKEAGLSLSDMRNRCDCKYVLCEHYMGAICTVHVDDGKSVEDGGSDDPVMGEAIANAYLIAAAPELYFWSKELLAALPTSRDWLNPDIERNLKAAIEKAEGKVPYVR